MPCERELLKILKFGSSVLRTSADLARVAGEVYRETRDGSRVIAIVSALEGETDALLHACSEAAGDTSCSGVAEVVSLGEEKTAALLKIACDRIGLSAATVRPEIFGIATSGDLLEGQPHGLAGDLARIWAGGDVLILPGFVGIDASGCRSLLGRGGSDFSAIFLGGELKADLVRLYKDVDGVFDHDPALGGEDLHRFDEVSFDDCLTLARPLLQPRAVEYAAAKQRNVEVGVLGSAAPTRVGTTTARPQSQIVPRPLRIALAGYGTVGQALTERLRGEDKFEIVSILVRDVSKARRVSPPVRLTNEIGIFYTPESDILVDLTCGEDTGRLLSSIKLQSGAHVVSANKLVIGNNLAELAGLAQAQEVKLLYSATVGGSTPVIETVRRAAAAGQVASISAILNGTVNFLLDQIAAGAPYAVALKRAQLAGFAEEDPSQDLEGHDAALKLRIIAAQLLGPAADPEIEVEPLSESLLQAIAASGQRWVQASVLAIENGKARGAVRLRTADQVPELAAPAGERNCVCVTGADGRRWTAFGRGAGGAATAEAVTADLYEIWRAHAANMLRKEAIPAPIQEARAS